MKSTGTRIRKWLCANAGLLAWTGASFTPLDTKLSNGVNVRLIGDKKDRKEIKKEKYENKRFTKVR